MAAQTRYNYLLRYMLMVMDFILLNSVILGSYFLTKHFGKFTTQNFNPASLIICNLNWVLCASYFGMYGLYATKRMQRLYRDTWRTIALHFSGFFVYLFFIRGTDFSRNYVLMFYVLLCLSFFLNRFVLKVSQHIILNRFLIQKKVAVIGSNKTAQRISKYLLAQRSVDFYGFIGEDANIYSEEGCPVSATLSNSLMTAATDGVQDVYIAVAPERMREMAPLIAEADRLCVRLKFVPDLNTILDAPYKISYVGDEFPLITLREEPLERIESRIKKRAFDLFVSSMAIFFVLVWLYPIIAFLIKLQSKGPVLFRQKRSGRNDKAFICYKFRSMTVNPDSDKKQATKFDGRITPIGKFLRRTSLDEMPQFLNVFLGHMSVVGPRPHMLRHTVEYKGVIDKFMVRHFLKPGITGWAQVNGLRGETKLVEQMEKRVRYDIDYLENWSVALDVEIIFLTVINAVKGEENAY
jgi:putative colanic acid biosynthesis UDP-glucose lipid carrier transferase